MNDKVYIVTSGSYSDYKIQRCFFNKQKAEDYMKICEKYNYDLNDLEEYDLDDSVEIKPLYYISAQYYFDEKPSYCDKKYYFKIVSTNNLDEDIQSINSTHYCHGNFVTIRRLINSNNFDEEYLRNKYEKVCQDLEKQIKYLIEVEGLTDVMINNWLQDKQDIIPESE
jgi:hypothetical protein